MRKYAVALFCSSVLAGLSAAQVPAPSDTFSMDAQAISLPGGKQTAAGTVVGGTFAITQNFALRSDNLIAPGANLSAYLGGFNYNLPVLSRKLNNMSPNLDGSRFQFYITASVGVDRLSPASGDVRQHYAALVGGGVRYDASGSGRFSVNLAEVRWAKLPGY